MAFPDEDFERFFTGCYDSLVRSLTAMTGDNEAAKDAVQDALVKAAGRWPKVRRLDDPVGWVRRVAINRSRDLYRADSRRRRREGVVADDLYSDRSFDNVGSIDGELRVEELLGLLSPQQRATAALFYIDDLSVTDIAEVLGLSEGAVKFHLSKAREALRSAVSIEGQRDSHGARRI